MPLTRRRRLLFACTAIFLGTAFGLILLEISVRIFLVRRAQFSDAVRDQVSREWGGDLTLFDFIRPAADTARVYEMIPGANGRFVGQPVLINDDGFRDKARSRQKPHGVKRVAVLGDSIAFGWGVPQEARFSDRLETMLSTSSTQCEVLNFAVPGYNTVMELATFRDQVLAFEPDVVLLSFVDNDDELPNFVRLSPHAWSLDRCFLLETIRDQMVGRKLGDTARLALGGIAEAGGVGHAKDAVGFRPELVPPEYRFLVGEKAMVQALKLMADDARTSGIRPVCVVHRMIQKPTPQAVGLLGSRRLVPLAEQAGFMVVDPGPALLEYLAKQHADEKALWINKNDFHPNAIGHGLIAEQLAPALLKAISAK
jgi:lysophospholipase L1-like esterase